MHGEHQWEKSSGKKKPLNDKRNRKLFYSNNAVFFSRGICSVWFQNGGSDQDMWSTARNAFNRILYWPDVIGHARNLSPVLSYRPVGPILLKPETIARDAVGMLNIEAKCILIFLDLIDEYMVFIAN